MGLWRVFGILLGVLGACIGHCEDDIWLIEQDFVKFGKKEFYESCKKEHHNGFVKKTGCNRIAIEDLDSSQYIYLSHMKDFKGLNAVMQKRLNSHKGRTQEDLKQLLPFFSTLNFYIETLHRQLSDCSFMPTDQSSLLDYSAVYYYIYGLIPGSGPLFEQRMTKIAAAQMASSNPVCFRTWRVLFGGEGPSYIVAVFANSPKEAKNLAEGLKIIDGSMKNLLRQDKKGSGMIRKDLSAVDK